MILENLNICTVFRDKKSVKFGV